MRQNALCAALHAADALHAEQAAITAAPVAATTAAGNGSNCSSQVVQPLLARQAAMLIY